MNHIYKVIWNHAKHCYTVVSEIAKSHSQSNKRVRSMTAVVAAAMMLTGFGGMAIEAANPANEDVNIEVGKGAKTNTTMGNPAGLGGSVSGYIAIGEKADAWNGGNPDGIGTKEYLLDFNQGAVGVAKSFFGIPYKFKVTDGTKLAGAIAIGKNTMARTGSVMIGDHTYKGQLGDIEVDPSNKQTLNNGVYSTTLGTSSYNGGSMSAVTGAFSIISNKGTSTSYGTQNFGATIYGSLNSIESSSVSSDSVGVYSAGMANSVLGFGNRTQNTNASLVWGTGNEVTNSIEDVTFSTDWNKTSASDAQKEIIKAMRSSQYAGGSVMAIGGGNKADWATYSQLLGVKNTLIGENGAVSKYDMINGYKNKVTNATNTSIIGSNNTATNIQSTIVMGDHNTATNIQSTILMGDHNTLEGRKNVISLGNKNTVVVDDAVAIGNSTKVTAESGVAIGVGSVADRVAGSEKGALGYFAPETIPTAEKSTWTSTKGAVSVGDTVNNITRQITDVAAGSEDTDAVNVAQLRQVASQAKKANQGWNLSTNGAAATNVAPGGSVDFSGDDNVSVSNKETKVTVALNKNINVNNVQTNALNAKYNLSVGTANENGTVPFFVNSNGAFYAANGKLVVDKDGKVTATEGEIGNVVLKNGVLYKNTALRDGELYVGDADGNYSQITPKSAKLGQVTIDEKGNMAGVNSVQTNALNAKYNLSVGTANENGTVPFFVNSNGAFYAANGKLVVDKDGKVTATEGEIGNVVLKNGVLYKNTALRDGELYVGDADGNYSQITSKNAKLGKVMIDDTGRISGVAAGRIAADSTDAINGSQLHAVQQEAGKHTKVVNGSNITVEETDQDGQKTYKVGLNKNLEGIESISNGDAKINLNDTGVVISKGKDKTFSITDTGMGMSVIGDDYVTRSIMVGKNGTVISGGLSVAGSKITNVAAGSEDTDAVNVGQLKEAVEAGNTDTHIKAGEYGVGTDNKVNMQLVDKNGKDAGTVTITDVAKASDVGDVNNIASDIKNQDGKTTVVDAVNNLNNKVGDLQYSKVEKGEIADGDSTTTAIGKLDQKLTDVAATAAKHTKVEGSSNITVTNTAKEGEAANYKVELKKDIEVNTVNANSVTTGQTVMNKDGLKVGEKVSVTENGLKVGDKVSVTENAVTAGQTSISDAGVKVGENTYISDKGLNANSNKITNVADGEENSDAVNYGQLKKSETTINNRIDGVENQVISNSNRINQLGDRVNKVGAGAAALAALHPLDFDPDDKWDFAAGYGNYNGENAAAIGAYYRPNEDTMLSVGGSFGNGENMVNAGVSLKLGQGNHVSTSKVAMAKEIKDLRKEMEGLKAALLDVNAGKKLDTSKLQLFPDVPKNHWAYEYVSTLKGNGALTGYPDGEFKGDRPMTRYEFATMLYKAMLEGATLSDRILKEFAPELERFTVDTVHQDKDGKPTVERVRTVKAEK